MKLINFMAYPIEIGNALTYLFLFAYPLSIILSDLNRFYEIETELERVLCVYLCVFLFQFQLFNVPASFISRAQYIQSGGQTVFSVQQTLVWNSIVLGHSTGSFLVVLHAELCVFVFTLRG